MDLHYLCYFMQFESRIVVERTAVQARERKCVQLIQRYSPVDARSNSIFVQSQRCYSQTDATSIFYMLMKM